MQRRNPREDGAPELANNPPSPEMINKLIHQV
jgi:hypothetical protein